MKVPKAKAIELIDKKIKQFENILKEATYKNRFNEDYNLAYNGTEMLVTELFSEKDTKDFRTSVSTLYAGPIVEEPSYAEELTQYRGHIELCISQLKVYREKVENFWPDETEMTTRTVVVPFVAMSFDEADKEINQYITGILQALQVDFETGERYSKDSIPEKVKRRITNCGLIISIFVRRDEIKSGGYTTPPWLIGEVKFAQGKGKDVIAWVEEGIKDIAGLNLEKEVIYFVREDVKEMEKATIKFLEALKEHKLI